MIGTERGQATAENTFSDFLKDLIEELEDEIISTLDEEVVEKDLIQYKGFIDVKSIFKNALEKYKDLFKKKSPEEINKFVNKNFKIGIESLEKDLNMNILGPKISTNKLDKLIQTTTFKDILKNDLIGMNEQIINTAKKVISQGIINGLSLVQIKKTIQEALKKFYSYSEFTSKTNAQDIVARGRYYAAKESGLNLKKYVSVHYDNRTSQICKHMGAIYGTPEDAIGLDEKFKYNGQEFNAPSFHPNCRTRLMFTRTTD